MGTNKQTQERVLVLLPMVAVMTSWLPYAASCSLILHGMAGMA